MYRQYSLGWGEPPDGLSDAANKTDGIVALTASPGRYASALAKKFSVGYNADRSPGVWSMADRSPSKFSEGWRPPLPTEPPLPKRAGMSGLTMMNTDSGIDIPPSHERSGLSPAAAAALGVDKGVDKDHSMSRRTLAENFLSERAQKTLARALDSSQARTQSRKTLNFGSSPTTKPYSSQSAIKSIVPPTSPISIAPIRTGPNTAAQMESHPQWSVGM